MPQQFDSWASYFYPETYDAQTGHGVMRNVPGIRDFDGLRSYDYRMSFARRTELELRPDLVARTFDGEHMKAIHGQLFGDVYPWAGQYRTVNMAKGGTAPFADAHNGAIDAYLTDVRSMVERTDWAQLDHAAFAERSAEIFSHVNTGGSALLGCELYAYDLPPLDRARNGDRGVRPRRDHRIRGASAKASSSIERSP